MKTNKFLEQLGNELLLYYAGKKCSSRDTQAQEWKAAEVEMLKAINRVTELESQGFFSQHDAAQCLISLAAE